MQDLKFTGNVGRPKGKSLTSTSQSSSSSSPSSSTDSHYMYNQYSQLSYSDDMLQVSVVPDEPLSESVLSEYWAAKLI